MGITSQLTDNQFNELFDSVVTQQAQPAQSGAFIGTPAVPGTGGISNGIFTNDAGNNIFTSPFQTIGEAIQPGTAPSGHIGAPILGSQALGDLVTAFENPLTSITTGLSSLMGNKNAGQQGAAAIQGSAQFSYITAIFLRAIVVITGFIFVAEGLSMFKGNGSVTVNTIKRLSQ